MATRPRVVGWIARAKFVSGGRATILGGGLVSLFLVVLGAITLAVPAPRAADSPWSSAKVLQPFVDNHTLAGAVTLVASSDRILSLEAVGYMDVAAKKPMRKDAMFWIASQSKAMTASALLMLADEGKVNVDDPVEKYLPEFKGVWLGEKQDATHILLQRPTRPIEVRDILSHTSGLPFSSPLEVPTLDVLPLAARVRSYAMMPLDFEPGTQYSYSNAGINTAGRIIEVVSGMPYQQFMEKRLFKPLDMKDTTFWPSSSQLRRLAKTYKPDAAGTGLEEILIRQLRYPLTDRTREPMPAGGLFSTASDVARFCRMFLNGGVLDGKRILSEAAVKQMTSRQTLATLKTSYGFGWTVGEGEFSHGGADATNMTVDTQHRLIFIWMVQHSGYPGNGSKSQQAFVQAAKAAFAK